MDNRWANNDGEEIVIEKQQDTEESSASRKMGIAMGIVGILLVAAGVIPMFMSSTELQGDVTATQEEVDPLVALLSGGTPLPSASATSTPAASAEAIDPLVALLSGGTPAPSAPASIAPSVKPSVAATPTVMAMKTPTAPSMVPTVLPTMIPTPVATAAFAPTALAVNTNVGKTDTTGAAFHNAAALENSSKTPLPVATTATKPVASHTPAKNVSAGPDSMPKTGADTTLLMLGIAFLLSALWYRRKNA